MHERPRYLFVSNNWPERHDAMPTFRQAIIQACTCWGCGHVKRVVLAASSPARLKSARLL
jgi:hypothetical protein